MSASQKFPMWISHNIHVRTVIISGKAVLKEPLRVGAGRGGGLASLTDLPVLKLRVNGGELPVIPGSTWKGVIRSHVEALLRGLDAKVCGGVPDDNCAKRGHPSPLERLDRLLRRPSESNKEQALRIIWNEYCLACKMFGAPSYMSNVTFDDSYPDESDDGRPLATLGIKPGIAIDRRSGAVRGRALYQVEFVEPGSVFGFRLTARNLPNYALGLLSWTILDLNRGVVRVGGFKSRGFGWVQITELRHEVHPSEFDVERDGERVLRGFQEYQGQPWYDPRDESADYDGSTLGLLRSLRAVAERALKR